MSSFRSRTLDAGPVLELIQKRILEMSDGIVGGLDELCEVRNLCSRTIMRMRVTGKVSYSQADKICCSLGVPTVLLYPYEMEAA